jgi:pimeloyl-ACP methyl ester carboxylesterase
MALLSLNTGREPVPLPRGQLQERELSDLQGQRYLVYLPHSYRPGTRPLVFIHGYSRQVQAQASALLPLCEHRGCALIAPLFDREMHPRYQQLGRGRNGLRADQVLDACLLELQNTLQWSAATDRRVTLIGFSGGAQFAHRYTMAHPQRVSALIAVAAGWYTMPEEETAYPLGLCTRRRLRTHNLNPERFLRVPTTVIVGAEDTSTINLRLNPALNAQQGSTRVARARRWVCGLREAARMHGVQASIQYFEVPGMGHDFHAFVRRGHLLELLAEGMEQAQRSISASTASHAITTPSTATGQQTGTVKGGLRHGLA